MILANYEPPPALIYQHPGADSYKGSFATAVELLARATGVAPEVLYNISSFGRCRIRSWRQGEVADAMVYGRNRVVRGVYLDIDSWPPLASRLISECTDGLGNSLILPEVCGNWAYERTEIGYWPGSEWQPSSVGSGGGTGSTGEAGEESGIGGGGVATGFGGFGSGFVPNGFSTGSALSSSGGISIAGNSNNNSNTAFSSSNSNNSNNNSSSNIPPTYISTPPNGGFTPPELIPNTPGSPTSPTFEPSSLLILIPALLLAWWWKRRKSIPLDELNKRDWHDGTFEP